MTLDRRGILADERPRRVVDGGFLSAARPRSPRPARAASVDPSPFSRRPMRTLRSARGRSFVPDRRRLLGTLPINRLHGPGPGPALSTEYYPACCVAYTPMTAACCCHEMSTESSRITSRDSKSNPGPVFSIPGFGIGEFPIPGFRRDYVIPAV